MDWLEKIPVDGKPRKISEWLTYLPEPDQTIALKHYTGTTVEKNKMSDALESAFVWAETPTNYKKGKKAKGYMLQHNKWLDIYNSICDHEQKFLTTDENSEK